MTTAQRRQVEDGLCDIHKVLTFLEGRRRKEPPGSIHEIGLAASTLWSGLQKVESILKAEKIIDPT